MPYYDYRCQNEECKKLHENIFHSIHVEKPNCPDCGGELKNHYSVAPPDLGSSIRVQGGIDRIRQSTHDKYLK
jgi:putative FmdB family regulatory protein